ncbi:V-set and transmembrane domain-containing protein 5 isoform X2 [Anolis carolinensis]|uniref:V-set and transmembrane domain-containing protein 5 isoform X2 n=1 Tax=Anolis carolinensis TaxID=28377 RepID=UPI000462871C|nr:PREDICTED: V-set and transmembrane domain-containing protein 5 [Anolis carolinensis]|eukprot:XP_016848174.1 PREDICTED: V-set and transmembrane domain-containing protein 5 [Anolis carolinensis]
MRPLACLQACRQGIPLGVMTFCLMAVWTFQAQGQEVSLRVSQPNVNTTVEKDILLSIAYTCESIPIIEWKHTSPRGTVKIAEWKPESYTNISRGFEDRVNVYENGSLQLLKVDLRDSGYYLVTVRDEFGITVYGTILLNVYEILYEDLHFVAVFLAFLTAASAILICLLWMCNKSIHVLQQERQQLKASTTEETELQMMDVS